MTWQTPTPAALDVDRRSGRRARRHLGPPTTSSPRPSVQTLQTPSTSQPVARGPGTTLSSDGTEVSKQQIAGAIITLAILRRPCPDQARQKDQERAISTPSPSPSRTDSSRAPATEPPRSVTPRIGHSRTSLRTWIRALATVSPVSSTARRMRSATSAAPMSCPRRPPSSAAATAKPSRSPDRPPARRGHRGGDGARRHGDADGGDAHRCAVWCRRGDRPRRSGRRGQRPRAPAPRSAPGRCRR
jgi:hypothetical protein